jgi:LysR family transcriptional activator of nhaA
MGWLNYHHFFYFWTVARTGSIARAAKILRLTEPTVSAQVHLLEESLGERLLRRQGRGLVVTEAGRLAQRYANHIFTLGQEFQAAIRGFTASKVARFTVGIVDAIPRLISFRLLEPALLPPNPFVVSSEVDTRDGLLAKLVSHQIDAAITDAPLESQGTTETHNHLLGESSITVFGNDKLSAALRRRFPRSLSGAPFLLPAEGTTTRRLLERWFILSGLHPDLRGEFTDSALLKTFGGAGVGAFVAPTAIEREIRREYRVHVIGRIAGIRERFYLVSASRKTEHPAIERILRSARRGLFR